MPRTTPPRTTPGTSVVLHLPEALRRLGLSEADTLSFDLARAAAERLGMPTPPRPLGLMEQMRQRAELPRAVMAKLAERFPDLVVMPGRVQGRALTPVETRLRRLLDAMPDDVKAGGLSFNDLRARLAGKYGRTARHDETADALRALGWVRVRNWRDVEGGFRSYWYRPEDAPERPCKPRKRKRDADQAATQATIVEGRQ